MTTASDLKTRAHKLTEKAQEADQLRQDIAEVMGGEEKGLTITGEFLKGIEGVGMSRVDPADIRPPQILLVQKMSDMEMMRDKQGKQADIGQYFHTGKREIYDTFDCHFLFASKGIYIDRRKEDQPEREQYLTIGAMADDLSLFGMTFRGTAINALSALWTATQAQHSPMFAFKVTMETKKLEGELGTWFIPVVRVGELVVDDAKFQELYDMAKRFDQQADKTAENLKEEE